MIYKARTLGHLLIRRYESSRVELYLTSEKKSGQLSNTRFLDITSTIVKHGRIHVEQIIITVVSNYLFVLKYVLLYSVRYIKLPIIERVMDCGIWLACYYSRRVSVILWRT